MNELELTIKNLTIVKNGIKKVFEEKELDFDMAAYRQEEYDADGDVYSEEILIDCLEEVNNPTCGSCCCALGGIPSITGLEAIKELDFSFFTMSYANYSSRVFPSIPVDGAKWEYLFGMSNSNCLDGFVERVKIVISELRGSK